MAGVLNSLHITNLLGLIVLLILWIGLFKLSHVLLVLLRREPLIGWAIGPLGITLMALHEPSAIFIWLDVLIPALISGSVLYVGFFTDISPVALLHHPLIECVVVGGGVLLTSTGDFFHALLDLWHPLWGEARVLRSIQVLRATSARVHFTPFGHSYLADHFGFTPTDLMQAM